MNKKYKIRLALLPILILSVCTNFTFAQTRYVLAQGSSITVSGTSTLHDWEMSSSQPVSSISLEEDDNGKPSKIEALTFRLNKKSLKSDKSGLNSKAYESLNADKFPDITFRANSPGTIRQSGNNLVITTQGQLFIAGTRKPVSVSATCQNGPGNTLICSGTQQLKMSDFDISPPVMMLGTLRTGDEITVEYNLKYTKQ